jgi:hypothetical protein
LLQEARVVQAQGSSIDLCALHTHVTAGLEEYGQLSPTHIQEIDARVTQPTFSVPPSSADILFALEDYLRIVFGDIFDYRKRYVRGAVTHAGIWYYRPLSDDALAQLPEDVRSVLEERRVIQSRWAQYVDAYIAQLDPINVQLMYGSVYRAFPETLLISYNRETDFKMRLALRGDMLENNETMLMYVRHSMPVRSRSLLDAFARSHAQYQRDMNHLMYHRDMYVLKSVSGEVTDEQYQALVDAYKVYAGYEVEFVPMEHVLREPPCHAFDGDMLPVAERE